MTPIRAGFRNVTATDGDRSSPRGLHHVSGSPSSVAPAPWPDASEDADALPPAAFSPNWADNSLEKDASRATSTSSSTPARFGGTLSSTLAFRPTETKNKSISSSTLFTLADSAACQNQPG